MRGVVLVGLIAAAMAHGAAAETRATGIPAPTTIATVPDFVQGFAQDGDHVVWAIDSGRCGRNVVLHTLSTGRSTFLDSPKGPMCRLMQIAGEMQPWMALAGTRALWARESPSLSLWNFSIFTSAPRDPRESLVGGTALLRNPSDENDGLRPVPMSGNGKMLVFADITNDEDEDTLYPGVYRMIGRNAEHVTRTRYAMSVGVGGSHFALARFKPAGCICNSDPAWSPDGARIAFVSGRTGDEPQLLVINADGTNSKAVIDGATAFVWSPDGRSFAVDQQDRVVIVKVGGAGVRTVDRNPCYCELAWAPDGRHLAYVRYVRGNEHLFVYAVKKGKTDDLGRGHSPRWSPDSRRIAYTRNVSGGGDRVFVGAVSGRRSNVDLGSGADPAWAPDGSALALQRQDGTYAIAPDGSATRRLGPSGVISPDWRWIAYEADPPDQTLWLVSTSGGTPRKLSEGVAGGGWQWSPDSRSIAFAESSLSVGIVDVETGAHRTSASGVDCSSPNWSADSTRMVCPAPQGTFTDVDLPESELAVVDARSGAIATVTHTLPEPQRMIIELYTAAGKLLSSFAGPQELTGIAWGGSRYALLVPRSTTQATIEIRSASGELLRSVSVPRPWFDELSMSGRWIVFRAGQTVRLLDALTGRAAVLARTRKSSIVGLSIDGRRIAWAESGYRQSRIRAVLLSGS